MMKKKIYGIIIAVLCMLMAGCGNKKELVVYTAVDQVYSEKIFAAFEEQTGIKVKSVYDAEANKTTGLVNRIIAEKEHPICDVFWNNEFVQTIRLEEEGVLAAYDSSSAQTIPDYYKASSHKWTAFGGRARVFLVNTGRLKPEEYPTSVLDFVSGKYAGKDLAIAYPMFGTTKTMAAALYAQLGEENGRAYFEWVKDNKVQVVDGNSVTKDMAAAGTVSVAFTDSDDAREALEDGAEVAMIYPDQGPDGFGTLMTPSTVAIIDGAPNRDAAQIFVDYLLSEAAERELVSMGFFDISIRDAKKDDAVKGMQLRLEEVYACMKQAEKDMEELFSSAN